MGISFLEALEAKYAPPDEEEDTSLSFGGGQIQVETVGWTKVAAKQKMLSRLRDVGLADAGISHALPNDRATALSDVCPAIQDLDLSKNPLETWHAIAEIVEALPKLTSLRLNHIHLAPLSAHDPTLNKALERIQQLSLVGSQSFNWTQWPCLFPSLTQLTSLFLTRTSYAPLDGMTLPHLFPQLRILGLECTQLSTWSQIEPLGALPHLEMLFLQDNALTTLTPSKNHWLALTTLNISNNQLGSWTTLHALNDFPRLQEVRLRGNPVLDDVPAQDLHAILTARIGRIHTLHGTRIVERDRLDSELIYLKHAARELTALTTAQFGEKHPRYHDLVAAQKKRTKVHGEPRTSQSDLIGDTIQDRLVTLTLAWERGNKRIIKKLPLSVTVRHIRSMVHRLFGLGDTTFTLKVKYIASGYEQELDEDNKELQYYALSDLDEILVV